MPICSIYFPIKTFEYAKKFFGGMIGINDKHPAFFDAKSWSTALKLTLETLEMSIMAIGFATIAAFLTVIPAARNIANGKLALVKKWYNWPLFRNCSHLIYIFSRSVPELVWAMIIIFLFKPGLLPGAIALALHNFGILGKLWAEVIEDMDSKANSKFIFGWRFQNRNLLLRHSSHSDAKISYLYSCTAGKSL